MTIRGILLDIEGTTTPITFVYDVLFPFAAARLDAACSRAPFDPQIGEAVALLREEHARDVATGVDVPDFGDGAPYVRDLMTSDRKSTGLKKLQGLIWDAGYASGELQGDVYEDVPPALARWREAGIRLRIYSSGSILAQKLLFSTTAYGDLTTYFEGFHDTTTGPKREALSYRKIAAAFELDAAEILFLSDVVEELDAAREAGMATGLLVRPGNKPVAAGHGHDESPDFEEIAA